MARLTLLAICLTVLRIRQSTAHNVLHYPSTIGFADDLEGTPPCGSFTVDFSKDNLTNFHVDGDFIYVTSVHPAATWLFRATLDQTASGNWTNLLPAVQQTGLGDFCETDIKVPSTWAGSKGVVGIVADAPDGILYQVRPGSLVLCFRVHLLMLIGYSVPLSTSSPAQTRLPVAVRM